MRGSKKFRWTVYSRYVKPLPIPSRRELTLIKSSLCLDPSHPFPRCPGKGFRNVKDPFIRKLEEKGDFSHSGSRRKHICDVCRCKRVAGWGTKHYGVGYCYYHDVDTSKRVSKTMAIALQQGFPLNPIKYRSDDEYVDTVRKMAEDAHGRLDLSDELVLLRAHIQEIEDLYRKTGKDAMTMKTPHGPADMTDDVKLTHLTKLIKAVSDLSRNAYIITESDYVHIDECKSWLWAIYKMLDDKCKRLLTGELKPDDMLPAFQFGMKEIALPKTGRRNK